MVRAVSKYAPYLYVLLRIVAGLLFACHGAQKLFGVFGGVGGPPRCRCTVVLPDGTSRMH
jgi:putative oxidoreductase